MPIRALLLSLLCLAMQGGLALGHERGWATAIAWSPDGKTIAVGSTTGVWFFDNDFVEVAFVGTPQLEGWPPTGLDWNASGEMVAVSNAHNWRAGIVVVSLREAAVLTHINRALWSNVRWHPEEDIVLAMVWAGIVAWDALSGEEVYVSTKFLSPDANSTSDYWAVCWLSGDTVAAISPSYVTFLNVAQDRRLRTLSDIDRLLGVSSHAGVDCHGQDRLVSIYAGVIDLDTGETIKPKSPKATFHDYGSYFIDVAWSPDGRRYLMNGNVGLCRIAVFDGETSELLAELQGSYSREHDLSTYSESVTWHPHGKRFAVVGQFDIRVWDANTYELLRRYDGFEVGYHIRTDPDPEFAESDRLDEMLRSGTKCPGI